MQVLHHHHHHRPLLLLAVASAALCSAVAQRELACASPPGENEAVIGDGNVILGVADEGFLNIPYVPNGCFPPLPEDDPAGIDLVGLRNPAADITAVEYRTPSEGWGVGIRPKPGSGFEAECGASHLGTSNIEVIDFYAAHIRDIAT